MIRHPIGGGYPGQVDLPTDYAFRESVFAWLRTEMLTREVFSRADLAHFEWEGRPVRLVGTQTGIWRVKGVSDAALSIMTAFVPDGGRRPYEAS